MKRWQSGHKIVTFLAQNGHVLLMCCACFQVSHPVKAGSRAKQPCSPKCKYKSKSVITEGFSSYIRQTVDELNNAITNNIPKMRFLTFGILYENDEGEYVVLNNDPISLRIAISTSKLIVGTDIQQLKVRVFVGSSPSLKAKPVERADPSSQSSSTEGRPSVQVSLNSDILNYIDDGEQDSTTTTEIIETHPNHHEKISLYNQRTRLERYIIKNWKKN